MIWYLINAIAIIDTYQIIKNLHKYLKKPNKL